MPKKRRRARIPTPAWERPRGTLGQQVFGRSAQFYGIVLVGLIVLLALGMIGFAYWSAYRADQERPHSTAVQVEETKFDLRYFSRRLKIYVDKVGGPADDSANPQIALPLVSETLVREEVFRRFAGDEGVSASEEEIKAQIEEEIKAHIGTEIGSGPEAFDAAFQAAVARTGLTQEEYRQMAQAQVLGRKVQEKLSADVPASAESVHYRHILVSDDAAAQEIKSQVESGADFAQLAQERSLDTSSKDSGGDLGWLPRGALEPSQEEAVFGLQPGQLTTIPVSDGSAFSVAQVLEKEADRPLDDTQKQGLALGAFQNWVEEKRQGLKIVNRMDLSTGDADNVQWAVEYAYQQAPSPVSTTSIEVGG